MRVRGERANCLHIRAALSISSADDPKPRLSNCNQGERLKT